MQKAISFNNVAIVFVKENVYRINFWYMSKDDAINIINKSHLVDKRDILYIFFIIYKNELECLFNLLSKKLRRDTK